MSKSFLGTRLSQRLAELRSGDLIPSETDAFRLWNGEDGTCVEAFGSHLWVVSNTEPPAEGFSDRTEPWATERESFKEWMQEAGFESASLLFRGAQGTLPQSLAGPHAWIGSPPTDPYWVREQGLQYEVNLSKGVQTGLFLDQALTRQWIREHANGQRVLNLFAYTGSLSIAAAVGGAQSVWTLDLARPAIESAKRGFERNGCLVGDAHRFWVGDAFDWLPQWHKKGIRFDMIVVDPPAFARSPKGPDRGVFRVEKHWPQLMQACWKLLNPEGTLIASHNVQSLTEDWTADGIECGAEDAGVPRPKWIRGIEMPPTFLLDSDQPGFRALKGGIYRMGSG